MAFKSFVIVASGGTDGVFAMGAVAPSGQTIKQCGGMLLQKDSQGGYGEIPLADLDFTKLTTVGGFLGSAITHVAGEPAGNAVTMWFACPEAPAQFDFVLWYEY